MNAVIDEFARRAKRYLADLETRSVYPDREALDRTALLDQPLQDEPVAPEDVLAQLDDVGSPATVAAAGGRYFGFVIGGAVPAALGAGLLASVWDQNAVLHVASPIAAVLEEISRKWLLSVFGLPSSCAVGFVTGATMANFAALAAARHALLERAGWDVERDGLFGAPSIKVVVGEEVHVSLLKSLSQLGLGWGRVVRVPADGQGRMRGDLIPEIDDRTILCMQAGNVNTGAFDPAAAVCERAKAAGAWVHVDGAFGLWAAAAPAKAHLLHGVEHADSWATDAHKWLNVPYDSGIVVVRDERHLSAAMSMSAAYLAEGTRREPSHYVPELSRRARGVEIWAALRSLGRRGLASMIERNCRHASLFADRLVAAGYEVLNEVVLNQVLVSFGPPDVTRKVIARIQEDGTCWCGGTQWQGKTAMRISVSSWKTTDEDVHESVQAILRSAAEVEQGEGGE